MVPLMPLLPVLLVLLGAFRGTAAVAVGRRDSLDLLPSSRVREEFYQVYDGDLYCRKCPAGTYVAEHCKVQNGSSKCLPCKEDEFIEYPNDFPKCFGCRTCREDQVQLSPCTATRNTQCGCRNGTFCSPDHPCEMCQKCRSRCLDDEVEKAPCTPLSDRQCGPPTDTAASSSSLYWLCFLVLPVIILLLIGLCCYRPSSRTGDGRDLRRKSSNVVDYILLQLGRCAPGGLATQDNRRNEQVSRNQQQELLSAEPPLGPHVTEAAKQNSCPAGNVRRKLVPLSEDPYKALQRSFDTFSEEIDCKYWRKYGRALDLRDNDITFAERKEGYSPEALVEMLRTWLQEQGMKASVNVLLETLDQMNLSGAAERISSLLVQKGLYKYEEVS
ncbi:tumor necrosis factor receptor superfamily member 10B [Nothoprocta perdicaria]|uniref:tumor necrosis factor receptor superfamily member 10B n=1 Tax=Nothoprocta perdicaria TaxID=30464 RepID=UPI000E1C04C8|nr:tumor necrosis factor receptor superfamily member 10B [Nothoprocta perdicaria]